MRAVAGFVSRGASKWSAGRRSTPDRKGVARPGRASSPRLERRPDRPIARAVHEGGLASPLAPPGAPFPSWGNGKRDRPPRGRTKNTGGGALASRLTSEKPARRLLELLGQSVGALGEQADVGADR